MNTTILAAADHRLVAGVLVATAFVLVVVFLIASALSSKRRRNEVPPGLRPGPSDEELESKVLPRFLAVSTVFLLFMSIYLPAVWLREPTRIKSVATKFNRESTERGAIIYEPPVAGAPHFSANCARCHGLKGEGTVQPFKEILTYAEPPLKYIVARYKKAGRNEDDIRQLIRDAIERGRPGTLMPTWGLAFGGPLNSQQVDDVVTFIYSIQEQTPGAEGTDGKALFLANCNVCHSRNPITDPNGNFPIDKTPPMPGQGGVGPDLREVLSQYTDAEVFQIIHDGRLNTNRPSMPTWAFLGDTAIHSIIDFLKTIQTSGVKLNPSVPSANPHASSSASPSPSGGK